MSEDRVFAKCAWRLIPFIALLYLVNFIDRLNVGFAAVTMNKDLGLSSSAFGLGAGIFFIGYLLFQVPANIVLGRLGARRWIFCILAVWGLISASTAFVRGPLGFYAVRFLLGVAESGFFPGMLFYLTLWFPKTYRARLIASFTLAIPISAVVGAPLSAALLGLDGAGGLHGWQWLFVLEGVPAFLLAFAVPFVMPDGPRSASWLNEAEKRHIALRLANETRREQGDVWQAFGDWRFWALGLLGAMGFSQAQIGTTLWLPQIVQAMGFSGAALSAMVALPYVASIAAMILISRSSDASAERVWHYSVPMLVAAVSFTIASATENNLIELVALTVAMAAVLGGGYGPFYSLLASLSTGTTAAIGIALANGLTVVGAFLGPTVIGILKDETGDYSAAMLVQAGGLFLSAAVLLALGRSLTSHDAGMSAVNA